MSQKEREFVLLMGSAHVNVSTKQIFWMRDLRDKYL